MRSSPQAAKAQAAKMARACRHSCQPIWPSRGLAAPMAARAMPKRMSRTASRTGAEAGPGGGNEPSGKARLSQMVMRPMATRVVPARRSVVSIRRAASLRALHLADLLDHGRKLLGVLLPPRVELVGVHVGKRGVELGVG